MKIKILIIFLIFNFEQAVSNIIYDKNDISITEIELNEFIILYENSFKDILSKNIAIKKIVLMKKTLNSLEEKNPEYLVQLDNNLSMDFGNKIFEMTIRRDFFRFYKIRNEFINEYFINNFNLNDLQVFFLSLKKLKIPISSNNCLTIENIIDLHNNEYFINNFYDNLKSKSYNYEVKIDGKIFDVCFNEKQLNKIDNLLIQFVENKIENNFNDFIYGKKY